MWERCLLGLESVVEAAGFDEGMLAGEEEVLSDRNGNRNLLGKQLSEGAGVACRTIFSLGIITVVPAKIDTLDLRSDSGVVVGPDTPNRIK